MPVLAASSQNQYLYNHTLFFLRIGFPWFFLRIGFSWLTPFPCTDSLQTLHARHNCVRLKIARGALPSAHAFAYVDHQKPLFYHLHVPVSKTVLAVFGPIRSAHGPADDSWRSWRTVLFDGESNGVLLELWGAKLAELRFMPAQGSSNRQCQCARARIQALFKPFRSCTQLPYETLHCARDLILSRAL